MGKCVNERSALKFLSQFNILYFLLCKCNLGSFTDPIPDGLMEEASDWDIKVTPVKDASDHSTVHKIKPPQITDDVLKTELVARNPNAEYSVNKTGLKAVQRKPKKSVAKKTTEGASSEVLPNAATSSLPKKRKDAGKATETVENVGTDNGVQDIPERSLPQIPSLSSFKRPVVCTSSFAELVEDYERFIKEGLEKHVEVIRVYTGSGSHTNTLAETLEKECSVVMLSDSASTSDMHGFSGNSNERTESSSSSSLSESGSDTEESTRSQGNLRSMELSSSCPDLFTERTDTTDIGQLNVKGFNRSLEEVQQSSLVKAKAQACVEEPVITNAIKPRKRGRKVTHVSRRELCQEIQDMYQLDYRNPSGLPYGTMSYADYWQSYYQAWQSYHSAVSSSYYRKLYKCSNWMSAYHMHSVYLYEMLKP